jgi:phage FluMu protein Com
MEEPVKCTKCDKVFKASGGHGQMKKVAHSVTCPYCGEPNEVQWPIDADVKGVQ